MTVGIEERKWSGRRDSNPRPSPWQGDALPTEPLPLAKSAEPGRMWWCREPESNWRHRDFQSRALPTELSRRVQTHSGRRNDRDYGTIMRPAPASAPVDPTLGA